VAIHDLVIIRQFADALSEIKGMKKAPGMAGALLALEIPLEGIHLRIMDDAENIAKILSWNLKNPGIKTRLSPG
jgi:hypothetical protein